MLIVDAEIAGRRGQCVRTDGALICELGPSLAPQPGEQVVDARGGALIPGLHDHHIHVQAAARAAESIECGPPRVHDEPALRSALQAAAKRTGRSGTVRGVGYHESVAGELDAHRLDAIVPDKAVRVQHRTGAMWILNHTAMARIDVASSEWPEGAERDERGEPTGRFFRLDGWLRARLGGGDRPMLAPLSRMLARFGVTGLTDTTPSLDDDDAAFFRSAIDDGVLLQRCVLMGSEKLGRVEHPKLARGALKILLDEPALPDLDGLVGRMRAAHDAGRAVAVHCVTRVELALALTALRETGAQPGDRIEHASVAPPDWVSLLADTPIAVVTQPHFLRERGDVYLTDVEPEDRPWLYRCRSWLEAGVPLAAGSDAPYGHVDPWRSMAAAVARRTEAGHVIGPEERLAPEEALALFTSDPLEPGRKKREIAPGEAADLVLLDAPWAALREGLDAKHVALTVCAGDVIYDACSQ